MKQIDYESRRMHMVDTQIVSRNIVNGSVLAAMRSVPRHRFVPEALQNEAYEDYPLPIGFAQTISQPYIVAYMLQLIEPEPWHRVLEIGTGSGYLTAVLARTVEEVYSIEIIAALHERAAKLLGELGVDNAHLILSDGNEGYSTAAPYDAVIVSAAARRIPPALVDQLKTGGRLCVPLGAASETQRLCLVRKFDDERIACSELDYVRFVPLCGKGES